MKAALAGLDNNTIIMLAIGVVIWMIRGGAGGGAVDQVIDLIRKILNRPEFAECDHGECSHDLDQIEGLVLGVKNIQDKLTEVGEVDLVQKLDAALPKLVTSQRAKMG